MRQADSGVEPLTPAVGDGEALSRDGPRSSRHASEAEGFLVPQSAWGGIQKDATNRCAIYPTDNSVDGSKCNGSATQQQLND